MEARVASVPLSVNYITIILHFRLIGYNIHFCHVRYTVRMVVEEVSFVRLTNKLYRLFLKSSA